MMISGKPVRWTNLVLWVTVIGLLAVVGWGLVNNTATRPEAGKRAPGFAMAFFNGYEWEGRPTADLSDLEGKVVVLNFWASWCVECRLEADLLEASWQKYRDQGVVFVGLAYADVEPNSLTYLQEFNITYPNAPDLRSLSSRDYKITGVPETFFIGKDGVIADVVIGPVNQARLDSVVEALLADEG
jgi:cytochrome c biogenesis protein CcmG/thiol:disulfide interchange protein DsbE